MNSKNSKKGLPWKVSDSIGAYLVPEAFPRPIEILALGVVGEEDTTWLIHESGTRYWITRVERGGTITSVEEHESHPLKIEGSYQPPLKYKVHMDADTLSPRKTHVIAWLQRLCDKEPHNSPGPAELVVGDVIFTGDSRIIRTATQSPWSHAALYIGKKTVAEAMPGFGGRVKVARRLHPGSGVYQTPAELFLEKDHIAVLRHPDWRLLSEDKFGAYSSLGWFGRYSILSALRSLLSKTGLIETKPLGVFCSQFVLDVYYRLGLEQLEHRVHDPYSVTPGDLFELLKGIGFETVTMRLEGGLD